MPNIDSLLQLACEYLPKSCRENLLKAYNYANQAHEGQKRMTGEPYIIHPIAVAEILTEMHAEESILTAALLHDVPEDTARSVKDIEDNFGKEIAFLVRGVTKLSKVHYRHHMKDREVQSLKRLLLHSAADTRIILIRLADRLHNMRTLSAVPDVKQLRIARETIEIYVPIANVFGIRFIKDELENLCFHYLFKTKYEHIHNLVEQKKENFQDIIARMIDRIYSILKKENIKARIEIKEKSLLSIYKRSEHLNKAVPDIEDIYSVIIIVDSTTHCYETFGLIHQIFKPKTGKIKDYIAVPKVNGYQSLHTTVFGLEGTEVCFQIRSDQMDIEARYGLAAQFFISKGQVNDRQKTSKTLHEKYWAKKIALFRSDMYKNVDVLSNLRTDIFQDRIFTFTPNGEIIDLPQGATAVDFAYAIHTELGNKAQTALINNHSLPLWSILQTGDTVKIVTDENQNFPKREWLSFVKTQLARTKIKERLRKEPKNSRIKMGREFLEHELQKTSKTFNQVFTIKNMRYLMNEFSFDTFDDLLCSVGEGSLDPKLLLDKIYLQKHHSYEEIIGTPLKSDAGGRYEVILKISGRDRVGFIRSLLTPIANLGINVLKTYARTYLEKNQVTVKMHVMITDFNQLSTLFEELQAIEGVESIERVIPGRIVTFMLLILSAITSLSLAAFVIKHIFVAKSSNTAFWLAIFFGLLICVVSVVYLRQFIKNCFADFAMKSNMQTITILLSAASAIIMTIELLLYKIPVVISSFYGITIFIVSDLFVKYLHRKEL